MFLVKTKAAHIKALNLTKEEDMYVEKKTEHLWLLDLVLSINTRYLMKGLSFTTTRWRRD